MSVVTCVVDWVPSCPARGAPPSCGSGCVRRETLGRCRRKVRNVRCGISVTWSVTLTTLREAACSCLTVARFEYRCGCSPTHFWVVFMIHRNIFSTERFGHTRQGPSPDEPASPASPMVAVVPATRGGCGPATGAGHRVSLEREAAVERGITSLDGKSHVSPKDPLRLKLSVFL